MWMSTRDRYSTPLGVLRMALFLQILDRFPPGRVLDLGAGHGMFARLAADAGWTVTAVDARDERFPADPRVTWVTQDIRECSLAGYDLICALGLWYHLTLDDQLDLARKADGTPLMIDTHIAVPGRRAHPNHRERISRMRTQAGFEGRLYFEGDLQDRATASFRNAASFWPTEDSLRKQLHASGYDIVETFDPRVDVDRRFFLATRIDADRGRRLDELIGSYVRPAVGPASGLG
jgi:SAM-dependent methyltransferase